MEESVTILPQGFTVTIIFRQVKLYLLKDYTGKDRGDNYG